MVLVNQLQLSMYLVKRLVFIVPPERQIQILQWKLLVLIKTGSFFFFLLKLYFNLSFFLPSEKWSTHAVRTITCCAFPCWPLSLFFSTQFPPLTLGNFICFTMAECWTNWAQSGSNDDWNRRIVLIFEHWYWGASFWTYLIWWMIMSMYLLQHYNMFFELEWYFGLELFFFLMLSSLMLKGMLVIHWCKFMFPTTFNLKQSFCVICFDLV